jgi:site-specific recombinase XerD
MKNTLVSTTLESSPVSPLELRDRAMFEVTRALALVPDAVVALDLEDVTSGRLGPAGEALDAYLIRARPTLAIVPGERALFLSKNGRRLSPSDVRRRVRRGPPTTAQIESKRLRRAYSQAHPRA